MLRTSFSTSDIVDRPLYREIFPHACRVAWREWRLWPLAILASILFTGGVFDILYRGTQSVSERAVILTSPTNQFMQGIQGIVHTFQGPVSALSVIGSVEFFITIIILLIGLLGLSCISQAGLIYGLASVERRQKPTLRSALSVGAQAFWPVALITAGSLMLIWITRFLISINLSLMISFPNHTRSLLYLASFIVFTFISFVVTIVRIFALNAVVLQGASASEALVRAYRLCKQHWIVCLETATLLFLAVIGIGVIFLAVYFLCMIPLIAAVIVAGTTQSPILLYGTMSVGVTLFVTGLLFVGAYATQLQYAMWTGLYRRFGDGNVIPKLHRFIRALTGKNRAASL